MIYMGKVYTPLLADVFKSFCSKYIEKFCLSCILLSKRCPKIVDYTLQGQLNKDYHPSKDLIFLVLGCQQFV